VDQVEPSPCHLKYVCPQRKALHTALSAFQKQTFLDECDHDFSFCSNHYLRKVERCAEPRRADLQLSYLECNTQHRRAVSKVADQIYWLTVRVRPLYLKRSEWGTRMGTMCRTFRANGNNVSHIPRTKFRPKGILVPTTYCIC
jgi:hypothetical protein